MAPRSMFAWLLAGALCTLGAARLGDQSSELVAEATRHKAGSRSTQEPRRLGWLSTLLATGTERLADVPPSVVDNLAKARRFSTSEASTSEAFDDVYVWILEHCAHISCKMAQWKRAAEKVEQAKVAREEYEEARRAYGDAVASAFPQEEEKAAKSADEEARKAVEHCELPEVDDSGEDEDAGGDTLFLCLVVLSCCGCAAFGLLKRKQRKHVDSAASGTG
mmetsp:Transcript_88683/g.246275  ORF Transcript_88683/g.246275 Transcript_88683/m.246275 type:complete len:221 (-) Transcript_88683:33-695(-)